MVARPLTPVPMSLPMLNVLSYGTATALPRGISKDRKTVYGSAYHSAILYQSTDDGATWTSVKTFTGEYVIGIIETDDGEALVYTQNIAAAPGYVYKSSGWTTSHTTATWTKVLTSSGGYFLPYWSGHFCSTGDDTIAAGTSKYVVANEYGPQTVTGAADPTKATKVYFSSDYGATWTTVLDLAVRYPGIFPLHTHSSAYDPAWDRIWVNFGDTNTGAEGNNFTETLYSDDHGTTWAALPLITEFKGSGQWFQTTSIGVFEDAILLGADNHPGWLRISRLGRRVVGTMQELAVAAPGSSAQMIASAIHRNRNHPGAPILASSQTAGSEFAPGIWIGTDTTVLAELWRDDALKGTNGGVTHVVGPTATGRILATVTQNTTGPVIWQLRGEIVPVQAGEFDGYASLTGDASTTVFNVAHGLATSPSRFLAVPQNAAAVTANPNLTVTVTATNLVFTFSSAPAVGTLAFAYRVAP